MLRVFFIISFLLTGGALIADEPVVSVSAPQQVFVGQQFSVVFSVNAEAEGFTAPTFRDFNLLSGPNQSTSSNIQFINGQVSRSTTSSFSFILVASKEGSYIIPEARVRAGGKQVASQPIPIKVIAANQGSAPPQGSQQQPRQQQSTSVGDKDVFLRVTANKTNPYQGEEIIVTYKIYTRVPIANYTIEQSPAHPGFWAEELIKDRSKVTQYKEVVEGVEYTVAEVRKVALFAQRSGKLRVEPMKMDVVAQVLVQQRRTGDPLFDSFFNDSFFQSGYQNVQKTLVSNGINLEVQQLPINNKPAGFTGAVGDFTFKATVDRTELAANEGVTLKMVISGKGNLRLIEKLDPGFPASFETFDPKSNDNIQATPSGVSGTKVIEYLAIPRSSGNYSIKPISFVYFNPSSAKFVTLTSPEFNLRVERGTGANQVAAYDPTDQQAIQHVGSDIRYIRQLPFSITKAGTYFFNSTLFWLLLALPMLLFLVFIILLRQYIKRNSDLSKVRNRKATRVAQLRLKKAQTYLRDKNDEKYYTELSLALWGYLSDKFNIKRSDLSLEAVKERLGMLHVNENIINDFIATLNNCEFARFAPGSKDDVMENLYQQALELITKTEKELK